MKLFEAFRIAMRALAANKLRSVLTMLGVIIGVGSVITLMSVGRGVEKFVIDQFASLGSNLLFITAGPIGDGPPQERQAIDPLTIGDVNAIADPSQVRGLSGVSAEFNARAEVIRGNANEQLGISAVTPSYPQVRTWTPAIGSFFSQNDYDDRARVAVIGADVYKDFFEPNEYPIDKTLRINNLAFQVIGVMEERGGGPGGSEDDGIFIPLSTAQDRLFRQTTISGEYQVNVIYASVINEDDIPQVQQEISDLMRIRRNVSYLSGDSFTIISQSDVISVIGGVLGALTAFLGAIAGISLLVGGIGIMNIMLVSVTERTREIGLRKAVGAKRQDILLQFLIEAITLSLLGGFIGVVLGASGAILISNALDDFEAVIGRDAILIALIFSTAVGLFFGIYPAYSASRLSPIDALRYE